MLAFIGILFVFSFIPYTFTNLFFDSFIILFTYLFFSDLFLILFFQFFFYLFTFTFSYNKLDIICYVSILLSHYVPNLLFLILQSHYLFDIYLFTSDKLIVFSNAN